MITRASFTSNIVTLPLQPLMPRPLLWGLVVLSLCAGLTRLTPPELRPRLLTRLWGSLPPYTLVLRGGDPCLRCAAVDGAELGSGVRLDAPLDLVLRPAQPVAGPVFVHAFLRHAGHTSAWPIVMERAPDGALLLGGIVRDLFELPASARGRYELLFVIQRSPLPPSAAHVQARLLGAAASSEPQLLRAQVEVLAPANP